MNALRGCCGPRSAPTSHVAARSLAAPQGRTSPGRQAPTSSRRVPAPLVHPSHGVRGEPATFACLHRQEVIDEPSESGEEAVPLRRRKAPNVAEERIRLFVGWHPWGGLTVIPLVRLRFDTCEKLLAARVEMRSTGLEVTGPVGTRSHRCIQISQCQFLDFDFGRWNRSHGISPLMCLFNHHYTTCHQDGAPLRRGEWLLRSQSQP